MKIFSIFGYGVPKDIMKDENYNRYLSYCFNKIFDLARGEKAVVIFSGGPTDCYPPYRRTEAGEMKKLFVSLMKRKFVKLETRNWKLVTEKKSSISTLENILYSNEYLKQKKIDGRICIFCELTREKRIKTLCRKVFGKCLMGVISIDFDLSLNRYLDSKFIAQKERRVLNWELKALRDKKSFTEYRKMHDKKLDFFRKNDYIHNPRVVEEWWKRNLK